MPHTQFSAQKSPPVLPPSLADNRIIDIKQLAELTGYSVPHLRRLYREKKIPAPLRIGGRKCGWTVATARKMTETTPDRTAA